MTDAPKPTAALLKRANEIAQSWDGIDRSTLALLIARALAAETAPLVGALQHQVNGHYATWMVARAEVEGEATARALFEKEPEVIEARAALQRHKGE
jgi:hypothetical protein